ncbi:MAG: carbohydrate ABC transporter permease [Microbacterium sp.]
MSARTDGRTSRLAGGAALGALVAFSILPMLSLFLTALQPRDTAPQGLSWPTEPHWENFLLAWDAANMWALLTSSLFIVVLVVPVSLVVSTVAGYALARLPFRGSGIVLAMFVLGLALPFEAMVAPIYYQMRDFGLLNTQWAIILPLTGLYMPFSVYWMRQAFAHMPAELGEASAIDGASAFRTFRSVFLPLAAPAWSSLAILLFLWTWNQFLLALVLVDDPTKRTMAGALGAFQGQYGTDQVLLCAGAVLIMAPTLVIFIIFQRSFISALLQGADK